MHCLEVVAVEKGMTIVQLGRNGRRVGQGAWMLLSRLDTLFSACLLTWLPWESCTY